MAEERNIMIEDDAGNIYYPHTKASNVEASDGETIEAKLIEIDADKKDYISHAGYGIASGTNAKTITLDPAPDSYKEGMTVAFKNVTQNSGAVTINVNGLGDKAILKSNGNRLSNGNLKVNSIYTIRYNGTSFILQGEGGEYGTALASDVLTGKTIGTEEGIIDGTMPNRGVLAQTITTQGGQINLQEGYYGDGFIKANFNNLVRSNIRNGVYIGGVNGICIIYPTTFDLVIDVHYFRDMNGSSTTKIKSIPLLPNAKKVLGLPLGIVTINYDDISEFEKLSTGWVNYRKGHSLGRISSITDSSIQLLQYGVYGVLCLQLIEK